MAAIATYALTLHPTPVFNTPDIASCFGKPGSDDLKLDASGLMKSVETILFPHAKVKLLEKITDAYSSIWKIETNEYRYNGSFYVDERFIQITNSVPPERQKELPSMQEILRKLRAMKHCRYMWGGNWPEGIDLLPQFYPSSKTEFFKLDPFVQDTWKIKGLDCSGLLYYLANGFPPRNTSGLVEYGEPVSIQGMQPARIVERLQDLDLIVWKGHVLIVEDQEWCIESRHPEGLIRSKLVNRLSEIMEKRRPVDKWTAPEDFVVRRWHPDNLTEKVKRSPSAD
jgi:hypothetical protein